MANDLLSPLGPLFQPNFITITQNDETGRDFQLQIYPDANNPLLRANGVPMQFYFVPQRVFLARKQTAPADFDFGMTVIKGLLTSDTTIGIVDETTGGAIELGGGFCTFSTTFAIPESVIKGATQQLKRQQGLRPNEPNPTLGIITIVENNVTIEAPDLTRLTSGKMSPFIGTQGGGKGSLEATGISTFLVSLNQLAAGAIAGALKAGKSPFTVHYNLKQQFYINQCQIDVTVDANKVFEQFSAALTAGGFLGINNVSLAAAYQKTLTSGAITTVITMNGAVVDDAIKKMIEGKVDEMMKFAIAMVKEQVFDVKPTPDTAATAAERSGLMGGLFGGGSVSMKANYQKQTAKVRQRLILNGTIAVHDTKSGSLNDLEPAIKQDIDKYLVFADVGDAFRKLQVAATNNVNWGETLPDGTKLDDPIKSIQVEVGYPDFTRPLGANNKPNPQFRGEGFHYVTGHKDERRPTELALWNKDNGREVINVAFLRLQDPVPGWDVDDVIIRKTISYDPSDPRVELANGGSTVITEARTKGHVPVITPDEVGYVFVRFSLSQRIPNDAISVALKCRIGTRTDTLNVTAANQKNIIWEIFSDKFINETSATCELEVTVVGPDFTDQPVVYKTPSPVKIDLQPGRIKYLSMAKIQLPPPPPDQLATINKYIKAFVPS